MNVRESGRCDVQEAAAQRFVGGKALCVSLHALFKASDVDAVVEHGWTPDAFARCPSLTSHLHSNWNAVALSAPGCSKRSKSDAFRPNNVEIKVGQ